MSTPLAGNKHHLVSMAAAPPAIPDALQGVRSLLFDVFGTLVDWRSSVVAALIQRARAKTGSPAFAELPVAMQLRLQELTDHDWARFAQEWRNSYGRFTRSFVPGQTEWKDVDAHHYDSLVLLLHQWGLAGTYSDTEVRSLSLVWHSLTPWEDSAPGLRALGRRYVTSTLSNGNRSLLQDLNQHGNLAFQRLVSSADFQAYKPHPKTYLGAASSLGCRPEECAMVAAHLGDLKAARSCGLRTIYVERPLEEEWASNPELVKEARGWVDVWIDAGGDGFVELARRLGSAEARE